MAHGSTGPRKRRARAPAQERVDPFPVLLLHRSAVARGHTAALTSDARLELIATDRITADTIGLAQRVAAVIVVTADDPLEALSYALTAGLRVALFVGLRARYKKDCRDLAAAGAAGCIVMPFSRADVDRLVKQLSAHAGDARVDSTLRLLLDPIGRVVRYHDKTISLSQREFAVLHCLSARSGQPVAADEVLRYVWGDKQTGKQPRQILEVYIFQLREKLERIGLPGAITTLRGFGYALAAVKPD